jgi:beta-glucosidase
VPATHDLDSSVERPEARVTLRSTVKWAARAGLGLLLLLGVLFLYVEWWRYPKRSTDNPFLRPGGPEVFKLSDIPRDHEPNDTEVEGYVDRLLVEMSLVEKVHQMAGDTWIFDLLKLVLFEHFKYNDRPIPAGRNVRLGIPPLMFSDGPRGVVLNHSTAFPVAMARGATWDRALESRVADAIGEELRAQGANFYGGVCINLLRHPGWGRAQETYGEDPYLLGEMAAALIHGVQRHNVMACAKHFALNSIDEPRNFIDVKADERTLREVYLPHFKKAVDAGVAAIMSSYNKVNGDYAAENVWLLRRVLKDEWAFRGFVMSDFFNGVYDGPKAARAGLDVEMPLAAEYGPRFVEAVRQGVVSVALVDDSVRRILRRKVFYATRRDPRTYGPSLVVSPAHVALAREVAEKSMVLLKNDGPLLPLDRAALKSLAVLGWRADAPNLGDHGSSRVYPPKVVTLLQGLQEHVGGRVRIVFEPGADLARARRATREADVVVVVVGLDHTDEGESIPQKPAGDRGGDRRRLALHPDEQALVKAAAAESKRVVVVLVGGSAITMEEWKDDVPAILLAWYPGMEGGHALARILFGEVNPSGKLPLTVPGETSWLPPFDPTARTVEYGYFHGYTLADKLRIAPAFAFGFGLSYTRFSCSAPRLSSKEMSMDGALEVAVEVRNLGPRAGEEVVQLYAGFPRSAVERPTRVLRGFEKVGLEVGETRTVRFRLAASDLAYYEVARHAWRVEPTEYRVEVGTSSRPADLGAAAFRVVERLGSR